MRLPFLLLNIEHHSDKSKVNALYLISIKKTNLNIVYKIITYK